MPGIISNEYVASSAPQVTVQQYLPITAHLISFHHLQVNGEGDEALSNGFYQVIPTIMHSWSEGSTDMWAIPGRIDTAEGDFERMVAVELDPTAEIWDRGRYQSVSHDPIVAGAGIEMTTEIFRQLCTEGPQELGMLETEVQDDETLLNTDLNVYAKRYDQFSVPGGSEMDYDWAIGTSGFSLGYKPRTPSISATTSATNIQGDQGSQSEDEEEELDYNSAERTYFHVFPFIKFSIDGSMSLYTPKVRADDPRVRELENTYTENLKAKLFSQAETFLNGETNADQLFASCQTAQGRVSAANAFLELSEDVAEEMRSQDEQNLVFGRLPLREIVALGV